MKTEVIPNGASKAVIEKYASDLAQALGYKAGGDLHALVTMLGGKIGIGNASERAVDGSLVSNGDESFTIYLSRELGGI